MELHLYGKNALVCGSSRGIGRAAAIELAKLGANITLVSRSPDKMSDVIDQLETGSTQDHDFLVADFRNSEELIRKVHAMSVQKNYQVLVNNTGGPPAGPIADATPDQFKSAFHNHLICNHLLVQILKKGMINSSYGRIINIVSTSVKEPIENLGVSNTIRGAVASWAKTLSNELGPHGITINNILPGFTKTSRLKEVLSDRAEKEGVSYDDILHRVISNIPLRRLADPEEVGSVIAFLASPAAAYINGVSIRVDGGKTHSI